MMAKWRSLLPCLALLWSTLLLDGPFLLAAEKNATVFGTPTANLRAGAGVEHALKLTLKEGDQVTVEKLEGDWYLVTTADGQKGYIHKNLLKVAEEGSAQIPVAQAEKTKSSDGEKKEPATKDTGITAKVPQNPQAQNGPAGKSVKPASPSRSTATPPRALQPKIPEAKSPSLLQMLEGHEAEVKIGLLIASVAFILGWFCGGHFYVRRERKRRSRLSF
jgi:hypothetical protein